MMEQLADDKARLAFGRSCDLYLDAAAGREAAESASQAFANFVASSLPDGIVEGVILPAIGTSDRLCAVRFDPAYNSYVTLATEKWRRFLAGHLGGSQSFLVGKG